MTISNIHLKTSDIEELLVQIKSCWVCGGELTTRTTNINYSHRRRDYSKQRITLTCKTPHFILYIKKNTHKNVAWYRLGGFRLAYKNITVNRTYRVGTVKSFNVGVCLYKHISKIYNIGDHMYKKKYSLYRFIKSFKPQDRAFFLKKLDKLIQMTPML